METTIVLCKKLWYYGKHFVTTEKNYDFIPKTMKLCFNIKKLWYYGKKTIVNYSKL